MKYNYIMEKDFVAWLIGEMEERDWSNSELARQAGLVPSTISMVVSEHKRPGLDFCVKVAKAFRLPAVEVLERANLIPRQRIAKKDLADPFLRDVIEAWAGLTRADREIISALAQRLCVKGQRLALRFVAEEKAKYGKSKEKTN